MRPLYMYYKKLKQALDKQVKQNSSRRSTSQSNQPSTNLGASLGRSGGSSGGTRSMNTSLGSSSGGLLSESETDEAPVSLEMVKVKFKIETKGDALALM